MYIVIELQTNGGQTAHLVTAHATREEAESKYHTVLAAEKHAAIIVSEEGFPIMHQCYVHEA